jgi:hypothetical protein
MQAETSRGPLAGPDAGGHVPAGEPQWRALLETRWRARLQEVTELALAYHEAAAAADRGTGGGAGGLQAQPLLRLRRRGRDVAVGRPRPADGRAPHPPGGRAPPGGPGTRAIQPGP